MKTTEAFKPTDWINLAEAKTIVKDFNKDSHNLVNGVPRLYFTQGGAKKKLKSWWISIEDINDLVRETNSKLNGKTVSGLRIYPALQTKDQHGNTVEEYHTVVILGTEQVGTEHNNVLLDQVQEYVETCPNLCSSPSTEIV